MSQVDVEYLNLVRDILNNGAHKETRSGSVKSVFGRMIRLDVSNKVPILTTKKMFKKGVIHELLWFLKGSTNIQYLVNNNVHIWDDDAYRWFKTILSPEYEEKLREKNIEYIRFKIVDSSDKVIKFYNTLSELLDDVDKNKFIEYIEKGYIIQYYLFRYDTSRIDSLEIYKFGDLGPVYGYQWRKLFFDCDQIKNVIDTLRVNPNDRRMIVNSWNVKQIKNMALPPCHYSFQFYTQKLSYSERMDWLYENSHNEYDEWKNPLESKLDELNVPKYKLSLMWNQRSVDTALGLPFNILSYSILLYMIAQCVNMVPYEIIGSLGDCHIYENHIDGLIKQIKRDPYKYDAPKLRLNKNIKDIDEFTYEDIVIDGYQSYPSIKFQLSVDSNKNIQ